MRVRNFAPGAAGLSATPVYFCRESQRLAERVNGPKLAASIKGSRLRYIVLLVVVHCTHGPFADRPILQLWFGLITLVSIRH
jgi:hypothetical protein